MTAILPTALDGTIGIDFEATSTTDSWGQGRVVPTSQGPLVWAKAGEVITEGQVVKLALSSSILTATLLDTTISGTEQIVVGVAQKGIASGSYGWFFRGPFSNVQVKLAASVNADTALTTTATAGTAGTGGDAFTGLVSNAASGAGGLTYCRTGCALITNMP